MSGHNENVIGTGFQRAKLSVRAHAKKFVDGSKLASQKAGALQNSLGLQESIGDTHAVFGECYDDSIMKLQSHWHVMLPTGLKPSDPFGYMSFLSAEIDC